MEPVRRAVIDVGTNSVKLLVADVASHDVKPVWEESRQTRLGRGFYETHRLSSDAITATAKAVAGFGEVAREREAAAIRVIATSAARDARNAQELVSAIEGASGLKVEIISGEQEADWTFQGVTSDPRFAHAPLLLLDVGGGSTEVIVGKGRQKHFRQSYPLGTVRLMEKLPHSDPPKPEELKACGSWLKEFLKREVVPKLEPVLRQETEGSPDRSAIQMVGTGGTATILACMEAELNKFDRERLEATRLSKHRLLWHVKRLWSLSLEERKHIVGLPRNRVDVILTGVLIYEAIMERFEFAELRVSTRGLRFAALMS